MQNKQHVYGPAHEKRNLNDNLSKSVLNTNSTDDKGEHKYHKQCYVLHISED